MNHPLSSQFIYLRDDSGTLGIEDMQKPEIQQRFRAFDAEQTGTNFGLTSAHIWLRLDFHSAVETPPNWLLEVGHASLDQVGLFLSLPQGGFQEQLSGDSLPFRAKPFAHRNHVFPLQLQADTDYSLYLRVASSGTLSIPVQLWQPQALWSQDVISYSILSLYFGLLIGLLIYNLLLFLSLRDPLYLIYVCFVGLLAIGQAGLTGFSGQFLWPDNALLNNLAPTGGVAAAGIFATLFAGGFLRDTARCWRLDWLMPTFGVIFLLTLLCALFWSYYVAAWVVNINSILFSCSALLLGCVSLYFHQPGARFFVLAWSALFIGIIIISLHNVGLLPSNAFTANALLIGSAFEMIMLSLALADRIQSIQTEKEQAQASAIAAKQAMLDAVCESERQLEGRITDRTLALEQANERLRESQLQLEHQANHDSLTGLANRKLLQDRLSQLLARAQRSGNPFGLLVVDLNDFKEINDQYGHRVGDLVLVAVAERLVAMLRASDTVARVGGDEFIVLLEAVDGLAAVQSLRDKLGHALAQPLPLAQGVEVRVGASIGIALYPDDADNAEQLLHLADLQMYAEKTRKRATHY